MQAYVYAAKRWPHVARRLLGTCAPLTEAEADRLAERFEAAFWCPEIETYALALDGAKQPCRVRTSNAGQVLFTGIAHPIAPAWSPMTLCAASFPGGACEPSRRCESRYNPMSYHNGSVWPHDNALIALGVCAVRRKERSIAF